MTWLPVAIFVGSLAALGLLALVALGVFKSCEISQDLAQGDFDASQWFAIEQAMMEAAVTGERVNLSSVVTVDFSKYSRKRFEKTGENAKLSGSEGRANAQPTLAQIRPVGGLQ